MNTVPKFGGFLREPSKLKCWVKVDLTTPPTWKTLFLLLTICSLSTHLNAIVPSTVATIIGMFLLWCDVCLLLCVFSNSSKLGHLMFSLTHTLPDCAVSVDLPILGILVQYKQSKLYCHLSKSQQFCTWVIINNHTS